MLVTVLNVKNPFLYLYIFFRSNQTYLIYCNISLFFTINGGLQSPICLLQLILTETTN
jgi:hypothetical protein